MQVKLVLLCITLGVANSIKTNMMNRISGKEESCSFTTNNLAQVHAGVRWNDSSNYETTATTATTVDESEYDPSNWPLLTMATSFNSDDFDQLITDNKVFLFTLKVCPYCKQAKDLLQ